MSATSHRTCRVGHLFAIQWVDADALDVDSLANDLDAFAAERNGEPFVLVNVLGQDHPPAAPAIRAEEIVKIQQARRAYFRATYYVVLGHGFRASMLRSVLAGMMLVVRESQRAHAVASLDEVFAAEGEAGIGVSRAEAHAALAAAGIEDARAV